MSAIVGASDRVQTDRRGMTGEDRKVIFGSSLGTVFEWYDFYLYGLLAPIIASQFFSGLDPGAAYIAALLAFSVGFLVRPLGAVVFGRLGDLVGRKHTFLITIVIMGLSTFTVGLLPTYAGIGMAAPAILIGLRMLQGLALGGEYGGAATYVAEHAPPGKRGAYTSWIQTTATLGLLLSLIVTLGTRTSTGETAFGIWGWRIPFLASIVLLGVSVWIRLSLNESPVFQRMKAEGKTSKAPLTESFGQWKNLRVVILALLGLTAGQAVVWYAGQFQTLFFLTAQLKVDPVIANIMIMVSLLIGTPFFVVFGALSDRIGRKPIIMAGFLLAVLTYMPAYRLLAEAANPDLARAQANAAVTVVADPSTCSFQGNPLAREIDFSSPCDIAKRYLAQNSVNYNNVPGSPGAQAVVRVGERSVAVPQGVIAGARFDQASTKEIDGFKGAVADYLRGAGYPGKADPAKMNKLMIIAVLTYLVLLVTMVYGPIAAMLVELFPPRIRYTSMSLPYHLGTGWFGGLMPPISFAIVASTGNMYNGLWYPIVITAGSLVIGMLFIPETNRMEHAQQ